MTISFFPLLDKELEEENFRIAKKLDILDLQEELDHANKLYDPNVRIAHTIPSISETQTMFSFRQNIIPSETTCVDHDGDIFGNIKVSRFLVLEFPAPCNE